MPIPEKISEFTTWCGKDATGDEKVDLPRAGLGLHPSTPQKACRAAQAFVSSVHQNLETGQPMLVHAPPRGFESQTAHIMNDLHLVNRPILAVTLGLGLALSVAAQPAWQWAVRGHASATFDPVYGRGIATDAEGNIYVAGKFSGAATFGDTNSPMASYGDSDAFPAKYSNQGQLQWLKKFTGCWWMSLVASHERDYL